MDDENLPPLRQREIQQQRKIAKPLMEKRRRERINNCLDQLKSLLIEVTKKDDEEENSYRSKLEKADILEMTVNYLKSVKRQKMSENILQTSNEAASASSIHNKYVSGFRECAKEVASYLEKIECLTPVTRSTLMQHLASHLQQNETAPPLPGRGDHLRTILAQSYANPSSSSSSFSSSSSSSVAVTASPVNADLPPPSSAPSAASMMYPVQLIPAKLATGQTVYVLANTVGHSNSSSSSSLTLDGGVCPADHGRLRMPSTDHRSLMDTRTSHGVPYEAISPVASPENDFQAGDRLIIADVARNVNNETKTALPCNSCTFDGNGKRPLPTTTGSDFTQSGQRQPPTTAADNAFDNSNQHQAPKILSPTGTAGSVVGDLSNMWRPW